MKCLEAQAEFGSEDSLPSAPFDYDWLFAACGEPVLIVDAATECIVEANPSALQLLQARSSAVIGAQLADVFSTQCAALLRAGLTQALVEQRTALVNVRARQGSAILYANLSMFRTVSRSYFLVRLASSHPAQYLDLRRTPRSAAFNALDAASFGFVMTDAMFRIDYANGAFVSMLERYSPAELLGTALERWMTLTPGDKLGLRDQLSRRIALTRLVTTLRRRHLAPSRVSVDAICVPSGADSSWGFTVRENPAPN